VSFIEWLASLNRTAFDKRHICEKGRRGMVKQWLKHEWGKHVAIVVGYVLLYATLLPFGGLPWAIPSGVRLACLLLAPYRYWPALIAADMISLWFLLIPDCIKFGVFYCSMIMLSPIGIASPIVWWCRSKLALFPTKRLINFPTLLLCATLVSAEWALVNIVAHIFALQPPGHSLPFKLIDIPIYFLGKYMAILFILPWVLMARLEYLTPMPWRQRLRGFAKDLFAAETLVLLLSAALFLFWISQHGREDAAHLSQLVVYLPIAWLALKPGWRAAAFGGTPAIACICSSLGSYSSPGSYPYSEILQAQLFLAVTVTSLFALGARLTVQRQQEEQERLDAVEAIQLARQSIHLNEARLRKTAQALELAGSALHLTHHQLLARFRGLLPPNEAQRYDRQAAATQNQVSRLADSMHPTAWRERGLPAALRETIACILGEVGIAYQCDISGRGLTDLASSVHMAIYRLACESVVYINTQMVCSRVCLQVRGGVTNDVHWAILRVKGQLDLAEINDAVYDISEREQLASKLGACGLELDALRNHVRLFDGELHERITAKGVQLTYLLIDTAKRERQSGDISTAVQLWVS
jgi:glucose-6-phosphate-specific signal transduction histidine kinase